MKKPAKQLIAAAIGFTVALMIFHFLKRWETKSDARRLAVIGEIVEVEGLLERKPPGANTTESVPGPRPFHHQELLITQGHASALLKFDGPETLLRLNENSRFVAELDPLRPKAVIATLLDGEVSVLKPGKTELIRFFKNGREVPLDQVTARDGVPAIPAGGIPTELPPTAAATEATTDNDSGIVITATKPLETPTPAPGSATGPENLDEPVHADILTNDDIVRGLKSQIGFMQRCYLSHLHREEAAKSNARLEASGGRIVVGFVIESSGKVTEPKIVRSDFQDNTLHSCIKEVLDRTRFKGFRGNPIPVREFPISLQ